MSYSTGETALLAVVRTCTGFTSANTSQANWKILNGGKGNVYAILRPGAFEIEWNTFAAYISHWTTVIEVWQRYKDDSTSITSLFGNVAALMTGIMPERMLNTTIQDSGISGGGVVQEMWVKGGGPQWLKWEITVSWQEETTLTFTD